MSILTPAATVRAFHGWLAPGRVVKAGFYRFRVEMEAAAADRYADLDAKRTIAPPYPEIIVRAHGGEIGRRPITRQLTVIGRKEPSTVTISSRLISACHCALYWTPEGFWTIDLLSSNGTFLEGRPIKIARFPPGGLLEMGSVKVSYQLPAPAAGLAGSELTIQDQEKETREFGETFSQKLLQEQCAPEETPDLCEETRAIPLDRQSPGPVELAPRLEQEAAEELGQPAEELDATKPGGRA